jgi:hypothetical protein
MELAMARLEMEKLIEIPLFTTAELAQAVGVNRGLVDVWMHRGVIRPSKVGQSAIRGPAMFSVVAIFEVKLIRVLGECLAIGPSDAGKVAEIARGVIGDGKSLWSLARGIERNKPIDLVVAISRVRGSWKVINLIGRVTAPKEFDRETAFAMVPFAAIFEGVYAACKKIQSSGSLEASNRKLLHARS